MLDWVFQIQGKGWATLEVMFDLLRAFNDLFRPQANLCSGGGNKVIKDVGAFLQSRLDSGGAA
jgi:hypothetical protein